MVACESAWSTSALVGGAIEDAVWAEGQGGGWPGTINPVKGEDGHLADLRAARGGEERRHGENRKAGDGRPRELTHTFNLSPVPWRRQPLRQSGAKGRCATHITNGANTANGALAASWSSLLCRQWLCHQRRLRPVALASFFELPCRDLRRRAPGNELPCLRKSGATNVSPFRGRHTSLETR